MSDTRAQLKCFKIEKVFLTYEFHSEIPFHSTSAKRRLPMKFLASNILSRNNAMRKDFFMLFESVIVVSVCRFDNVSLLELNFDFFLHDDFILFF